MGELQFTEQPGKDMIAEMKERMRRDNVSTFFALPLFAPQTTTTQDALFYDELKHHLCRTTAGSDKKYFKAQQFHGLQRGPHQVQRSDAFWVVVLPVVAIERAE